MILIDYSKYYWLRWPRFLASWYFLWLIWIIDLSLSLEELIFIGKKIWWSCSLHSIFQESLGGYWLFEEDIELLFILVNTPIDKHPTWAEPHRLPLIDNFICLHSWRLQVLGFLIDWWKRDCLEREAEGRVCLRVYLQFRVVRWSFCQGWWSPTWTMFLGRLGVTIKFDAYINE